METNNQTPEQQPMSQEAAAAQVQQVFEALGQALQAITQEQENQRQVLGELIKERATLVTLVERLSTRFGAVYENQVKAADAITSAGKLLKAMDQRIDVLARLWDSDHEVLIKHGLAKPRPAEDPNLVN